MLSDAMALVTHYPSAFRRCVATLVDVAARSRAS
jgi:hypothetical protein